MTRHDAALESNGLCQSPRMETAGKICARCKEWKDAGAFNFYKRNKSGLTSYCKVCNREVAAKYSKTKKGKESMRFSRSKARAKAQGGAVGVLPSLSILWERQEGKCAYCDLPLPDKFELDHVIPIAMGGSHMEENVVLACKPCNRQKHVSLWLPTKVKDQLLKLQATSSDSLAIQPESDAPMHVAIQRKKPTGAKCTRCQLMRSRREFYGGDTTMWCKQCHAAVKAEEDLARRHYS